MDMKRPENHATKVKLGLLMKMLEKDPTLLTIQKTGVTKKSNELFGEVARQVTKQKSSNSSGAKPSSWFLFKKKLYSTLEVKAKNIEKLLKF